MLIIWRFILLVLVFLAALVCFPDYPNTTPITIFIMFIISFISVLILTFIFSLLLLGRSHVFNCIFDLLIILVVGYFLLNIMPQTDGVSPYDKIMSGKYPDEKQIERGIKKLDFTSNGIKEDVKKTTEDLNRGIGEIQKVISKEVKN